jgi:hypothetical protein
MLRSTVLALSFCGFVIACGASMFDGFYWPFAFWTGLLTLALGIERRRYGATQRERPGAGWQQTGELFYDDASGHRVEVWFEPATGARRYVQSD